MYQWKSITGLERLEGRVIKDNLNFLCELILKISKDIKLIKSDGKDISNVYIKKLLLFIQFIKKNITFSTTTSIRTILNDHVTLKTGVMAAENWALPSQE